MLHAAIAVLTWNVVAVFVCEIGGLHHSHSWRRFCGWRCVFFLLVSSLSSPPPPSPSPPAPCSHYFPPIIIFPLTWNLLDAGFMLLLLTVIMLRAAIVVLTSSLLFVMKVQCTKFLEGFSGGFGVCFFSLSLSPPFNVSPLLSSHHCIYSTYLELTWCRIQAVNVIMLRAAIAVLLYAVFDCWKAWNMTKALAHIYFAESLKWCG